MMNLEKEYNEIENEIKKRQEIIIKEKPLDTIMEFAASKLNSLANNYFSSVYSLSLSLLLDYIIDINFPEELSETQHGWYNYSYLNNGYIGYCCRKAQEKKNNAVFILKNKGEIAMAPEMTQKSFFLTHQELQSFCVAPVLIGEHIVGAIQLSFRISLDLEESRKVESFLNFCIGKITWLLYSEQVRLSSILEIAKIMTRALESKDNYQAHHSENVANLVNLFIFVISRHEDYKRLLFRTNENVTGLSLMKLRLAALLHDIGKFSMENGIYDNSEPAKLEDKCKRRLHPYFSYYILNTSFFTKDIAMASAFHHERINGKGYPFVIPGKELSVEAQVISFADKFDSIARKRKNKNKRSSFESVIEQMQKPYIKDAFSNEVYLALIAIIKDYFDHPEKFPHLSLRDGLIFKELLGIPGKIRRKPLNGTELSTLFKLAKFNLSKLSLNQWWVMIILWNDKGNEISIDGEIFSSDAFSLTKRINKKRDGRWWEKNNWTWKMSMCRIMDQTGFYIGFHKPDKHKERAYAFCEDLSAKISKDYRMAATFIDGIKSCENSTILNIREKLISTVKKMEIGDRWRLLMD